MFIASKLKKTNIVEYLIYMWQIEDLIRALQFDIDSIEKHIIAPYDLNDADKKALYEWYESLIDMMKMEHVKEKGHIQLNKNTIIMLNDFHHELLNSGLEAGYNSMFYSVLPSISLLREKQKDEEITDIELTISFLYGIMLLKMKGSEISQETARTQKEITKFLTLLNKHYFRHLAGELDFNQ